MIDYTTAVCRFRDDHRAGSPEVGKELRQCVKVLILECNKSKHIQHHYTTFTSVCVCAYIAGQLMHGSILGHVVLFVRVILRTQRFSVTHFNY